MEHVNGAIQLHEKRSIDLSPGAWVQMKEQASVMIKSGFLPASVRTPEQAIAIAMAGKELGIGFMESLRSINVIQGKPTVSPQLMLALANRTGQLEDIAINADEKSAVVTVVRKGRKPHSETFGIIEATAMGLIHKDNYKKQAATMFKWRAIAAALRVTFPDVVLGLYTPEELGAHVVVGEDEEMMVDETVRESKPIVEQKREEQVQAIVDQSKDSFLKETVKTKEVTVQIKEVHEKSYAGGTKFFYVIKDTEDVEYTTFSVSIHDVCEEARINEKKLLIKYQFEPGKGKNAGKIFKNLTEAGYVD